MKKILLILSILLAINTLQAQNNVGIGTLTPNANALVDMEANDKGLLIPRLTTTQRTNIPTTPTEIGLLVFDVDDVLFYFWNGLAWIPFPQTTVSTDDQNLTGASLVGTTLTIDIENGTSASVNLSSLQDGTGTDDQTITISNDTLYLEDGGSR